ncbi:MAG: 2-oxoacid:acceptor oxidoreductase family protein, partial [Chloroflexia bacterium]
DADLVQLDDVPPGTRVFAVPATRLAEELGRSLVANIVMLGFFTAVAGLISEEAMLRAILDSVPRGTEELNRRAFETGLAWGRRALGGELASPA